MNSAGPYTQTIGGDIYNNGRGRARLPGVARNTLVAERLRGLDLHASRRSKLAKGHRAARDADAGRRRVQPANRVNYGSFVGTISSPLYLQPVNARTPRQLQFSLRFKS